MVEHGGRVPAVERLRVKSIFHAYALFFGPMSVCFFAMHKEIVVSLLK